MISDFSNENMISFKINDTKYTLHNYVLKDTIIHNILNDCSVSENIELTWNISPKNVDIALHCLHNEEYGKKIYDVDGKMIYEIMTFLKYFGVSHDRICDMIYCLMKDNIFSIGMEFFNFDYNENVANVLDLLLKRQENDFPFTYDQTAILLVELKQSKISVHDKYKFAKKFLQLSEMYINLNTQNATDVEELYKIFGFDAKICITHYRNKRTIKVTCNNYVLDLVKSGEQVIFRETFADHLSKLLAGILKI